MLVRLAARRFRNLEPLVFEPGPGRHLIVGANGAGKTSLLEAAYLLATTRSFRTVRLAEAVRHGESAFALAGEVEDERRTRLEVAWSTAAGGDGAAQGRTRAVNGRRVPLAEHLAVLPVVAWTAADAELLAGPPVARRRFLDRGVVARRPVAIAVLARCRGALAAKRELLLRGGAGLDAWNGVLAAAAAELAGQRDAHVAELAAALAALLAAHGPGGPEVALRYRPSPPAALEGAEALEEALREAAPRERAAGRLLVGPQRDDLDVRWGGRPVRAVASAGERKALGLFLLAAQARVLAAAGRAPLVLLDDADAELDRERLAAVWGAFAGVAQLVATSSRPEVWEGAALEGRWGCVSGRVEAL